MPTAPTADVAHLLQRFRARSGLTQEALAEATGLSVESIGALECGRRRHPRPTTIEALANALTLSPTESQLFARVARRPGAGKPCLPAPIADFTGRDAQLAEFSKAHQALTEGLAIALRFPAEQREPTLRHHLGRALAGLGMVAQARAEWKKAIVLYDRMADPRAAEVRELLGREG